MALTQDLLANFIAKRVGRNTTVRAVYWWGRDLRRKAQGARLWSRLLIVAVDGVNDTAWCCAAAEDRRGARSVGITAGHGGGLCDQTVGAHDFGGADKVEKVFDPNAISYLSETSRIGWARVEHTGKAGKTGVQDDGVGAKRGKTVNQGLDTARGADADLDECDAVGLLDARGLLRLEQGRGIWGVMTGDDVCEGLYGLEGHFGVPCGHCCLQRARKDGGCVGR
jgi:hypothetical protein